MAERYIYVLTIENKSCPDAAITFRTVKYIDALLAVSGLSGLFRLRDNVDEISCILDDYGEYYREMETGTFLILRREVIREAPESEGRYKSCVDCDCWNPDAEACMMSPLDRAYACPLYSDTDINN